MPNKDWVTCRLTLVRLQRSAMGFGDLSVLQSHWVSYSCYSLYTIGKIGIALFQKFKKKAYTIYSEVLKGSRLHIPHIVRLHSQTTYDMKQLNKMVSYQRQFECSRPYCMVIVSVSVAKSGSGFLFDSKLKKFLCSILKYLQIVWFGKIPLLTYH